MGLDDWPNAHSTEIAEERILRSAQSILGQQVKRFLTPPRGVESRGFQTNWFDEARQIGVPVAPFPRWMVCSKCRLLAPISSGLFEPKAHPYRPDRACYVHNCTTQGRAPLVVPARFMVTCEHGHLDDFPWVDFVHDGTTECKGLLYLYEVGASGEALDVEVKCDGCGNVRRMGQAFGPNNRNSMPACRGRRPHLRDIDPDGCDQEHVKPMLQGASNLWFPVLISALSVPQAADDLGRLVEENWVVLEKAVDALPQATWPASKPSAYSIRNISAAVDAIAIGPSSLTPFLPGSIAEAMSASAQADPLPCAWHNFGAQQSSTDCMPVSGAR
jgi:hypothetical protein